MISFEFKTNQGRKHDLMQTASQFDTEKKSMERGSIKIPAALHLEAGSNG